MTYAIYDSSCEMHSHRESLREAFEACQKRQAGGYREAYVINPDGVDVDNRTGLTEDEELQLEEWESAK